MGDSLELLRLCAFPFKAKRTRKKLPNRVRSIKSRRQWIEALKASTPTPEDASLASQNHPATA